MTNSVYFDQVVRAVGNPENWEQMFEDSPVLLNWNFVDADVFTALGPDLDADRDEVDRHYRLFEEACRALEAARGEPYPSTTNKGNVS